MNAVAKSFYLSSYFCSGCGATFAGVVAFLVCAGALGSRAAP